MSWLVSRGFRSGLSEYPLCALRRTRRSPGGGAGSRVRGARAARRVSVGRIEDRERRRGRVVRGLAVDLAVSSWSERRRFRAGDFPPELLRERKVSLENKKDRTAPAATVANCAGASTVCIAGAVNGVGSRAARFNRSCLPLWACCVHVACASLARMRPERRHVFHGLESSKKGSSCVINLLWAASAECLAGRARYRFSQRHVKSASRHPLTAPAICL